MRKTLIKSIVEDKVQSPSEHKDNQVSITFEVEKNGQTKVETITLVGPGSLKAAALV